MTVPQEKQMNAGVELLLKRMETHPEEFDGSATSHTKWGGLINLYKDYLAPEDKEALFQGINKILQQRFTEKVLEGLIDPKSSNGGNDQYYQNLKNTALGGATQGGYTLTSDGTGQLNWGRSSVADLADAQAYQMEQMKIHLEAHRAAIAAEEKQKKISMLERILGK